MQNKTHGSNLRFTAGSFAYNGRVACALLPSMALVCAFGSPHLTSILLVGTMITYTLDAARQKEAAISTIWVTVGLAQLANVLFNLTSRDRDMVTAAMSLTTTTALLLQCAFWATLQFKWFQLQYPAITLALERLLLLWLPTCCAAVLTWAAMAAVGLEAAPFCHALLLCALYCMFSLPLASSFSTKNAARAIGGSAAEEGAVQTRADAVVQATLLTMLPAAVYAASHARLLADSTHFWSVVLLLSMQLLFLGLLPGALWWLPTSVQAQRALQSFIALIASGFFIFALEVRVIFYAFAPYLRLHPPWSWIFVTAALYGLAAVAIMYWSGWLGEHIDTSIAGVVLVLCAAALGLAVGLPITILPFALGAAAGLAMFMESGNLLYYLVFVIAAFVTSGHFVWAHFWFLDIHIGGVSLHAIVRASIALLVPALLLPGIVAVDAHHFAADALLMFQACVLSVVEEHLYISEADTGSPLYPAYLVVATAAFGTVLSRALATRHVIFHATSWMLQCICLAKLSMLVLPEARLVMPVTFLTLTVTLPLLLYDPPSVVGGRASRPAPWKGALHMLLLLLAVGYARFALFDIVQWSLDSQPPEGLLLGVLVLAFGLGCIPLVLRCFVYNQGVRSCLALVTAVGLLLVLLRPPLPIRGGAKCPPLPFHFCPRLWDERHVPQHETDNVAVYGSGVTRAEHWPLWLLVAAGVLGLAAASPSTVPLQRSWRSSHGRHGGDVAPFTAQLTLSIASATCIGLYIALEFFPMQIVLQGLMITSTVCTALVLLTSKLPAAQGSQSAAVFTLLWAGSFPLAVFAQSELPPPPLPDTVELLFPGAGDAAEAERSAERHTAVLMVFTLQGLLLAAIFKLQLASKAAQQRHSRGADGAAAAAPMRGYNPAAIGRMHTSKRDSSTDPFQKLIPPFAVPAFSAAACFSGPELMLKYMADEGLSWMAVFGNVITLVVYALSLYLSFRFALSLEYAAFILAPLLLLLNQDPIFLRRLSASQRYLPCCMAVSANLFVHSLYQVLFVQSHHDAVSGTGSAVHMFKNIGLLALSVPSHAAFLVYLWTHRRQSDWLLLLAAPLNLLGLLLSDFFSAWLFALTGVVGTILQFFAMRYIRRRDLKLI